MAFQMNIPDEAVEAAAKASYHHNDNEGWDTEAKWFKHDFLEDARAQLEAAAPILMAQAWAEGFKQGGPMHDVNYDDPDAHKRNPYR